MPKKIGLLLAFIFIALTIIYLIRSESRINQIDPFFPGLTASNISQIDIDYFTQGTRLTHNNGSWLVASRKNEFTQAIEEQNKASTNKITLPVSDTQPEPANQEHVAAAINTLIGLQKETLVSSNPEKQGLFEVTKAGLTVTITQTNNQMRRLIIGKAGPTPYSTYVRLADENNVYLVNNELPLFFNKTLEDWKKTNTDPANQKE